MKLVVNSTGPYATSTEFESEELSWELDDRKVLHVYDTSNGREYKDRVILGSFSLWDSVYFVDED